VLRIVQNCDAARAKSYYTKGAGEYYLDGQQQEFRGVWRGEGAKKLGLAGEITKADWHAICDGLNPKSGEKLLQRIKDHRTIGYDFTFDVPKSVSLLYGLTRDERIMRAFRESVDATMHDIESEMQTRVRKNGKNEDRRTGNMVWGEFVHLTSRPMDDGIPDAQLHSHCFVLNATKDDSPGEGIWKAGQFREIKRDAPYFQAMFHGRVARKLAELGLAVERTRDGWGLAGVPRGLVDKFSRRTKLIEATAKAKGITDPAEKAELGAKTRNRKAKDLTMEQLQDEWRSRMTPQEVQIIERLQKQIGGKPIPTEKLAAEHAMSYATQHEFERRSVMPVRSVLATAINRAIGRASVEQVLKQADRSGLIVGERNGQQMATTREVLGEEMAMLEWCRKGRGTMPPLGKPGRKLKREKLNASQRAAVRHILHDSRDRVILLRGAAGTGKSMLMSEVADGIKENGGTIVPLAPTAEATEVLRRDRFKAETLAMFLKDPRRQQRAHGSVLWCDEAGLVGSKTMAEFFRLADKLDSRVILTGDKRQNPSVERGSVLHLLETEAGIKNAEVTKIERQRDAYHYKEAVEALSQGKSEEGFSKLDRMGWVHEIADDSERYKRLAADYADTIASGRECLVVAPTHVEGKEHVTREIRRVLNERGMLGKDHRVFRVLQNANLTEAQRRDALQYLPSDVLQFHQNAKGYRRGERLSAGTAKLPLDLAKRFTVFRTRELELAPGDTVRITCNGHTKNGAHKLTNGKLYRIEKFTKSGDIVLGNGWVVAKDFGHMAHGYCVTNFGAQGKTVKHRVLVAQSSMSLPATTKEGFYVACSRAKQSVGIYCDDKESLKEAIGISNERITATELVNQAKAREAVELHRRLEFLRDYPETERDKELVHER
jgi:conjugative relaxase-like TrwC/TraI family protein